MKPLTQQRLQEVLDYNPKTGIFKWKKSGPGIKANGIAGCKKDNGYRKLAVDGKTYLEHRLAWLYMVGEFPDTCLTHGNYERADNAWDNIVESTKIYSPVLFKLAHIASLATRIDKLAVLKEIAKQDLQNMQAGGI